MHPQEQLDRTRHIAQKSRLSEPRIEIEVLLRGVTGVNKESGAVLRALEESLHRQEPQAVVTPFVFPASSDGNSFRAKGHAVLGLLPCVLDRGEIEAIHWIDERLSEGAAERGVKALVETPTGQGGTRAGQIPGGWRSSAAT